MLPAGPALHPLRQFLRFARQPLAFLTECAHRYGDAFMLRLPGRPPLVLFSHPDAVREIFTRDGNEFGVANVMAGALLGEHSLLRIEGDQHRRARRMMQPPFQADRLHAYGELMRVVTDRSIDAWPLGPPFPLYPRMQEIALDVILRAALGSAADADIARLRRRLMRLLSLGESPLTLLPALLPWLRVDWGPLSPWGRLIRRAREVDAAVLAEIGRRRMRGLGSDILATLMGARDDSGCPMSDAQLKDQLVTILLAGHETTATSLVWVIGSILRHAQVREHLQEERLRVAGTTSVGPQHIPDLDYLDATVKEALRLNPILPLVARRLIGPMRIAGYDLPAGVDVAPCIYLAHRREDLWVEPERFDPDRFLGKRPSPYAFFPFGGGTRFCLGAAFAMYEMKIVVAQILSRAALSLAPGYALRVVRRTVTLAPAKGLPVVLESRAA